jgi:hypothetical protein
MQIVNCPLCYLQGPVSWIQVVEPGVLLPSDKALLDIGTFFSLEAEFLRLFVATNPPGRN